MHVDKGKIEAWCGGSNLAHRANQIPFGVLCRRPLDFKGATSIQASCCAGISKGIHKLKAMDEDDGILTTTWLSLIKHEIESRGMDSVFRVPNASHTDEICLLESWDKAGDPDFDTDDWQDQLLVSGVLDPDLLTRQRVCTFDRQNLTWSGKCLLNSISNKLCEDVMASLDPTPTGLEVLIEIITTKEKLDSSGIRHEERKLQELKIQNEPGENVINFNKKVKGIAIKLDNCGRTPDLIVLVAKAFIHSSVDAFKAEATQIHNSVNNPRKLRRLRRSEPTWTWKEILDTLAASCRTLLDDDEWLPAKAVKRPAQANLNANEVNKVNQRLNKLEARFNNNNHSNNNSSGGNNGKSNLNTDQCWDCGAPGFKRGHDGCPTPNSGKFKHTGNGGSGKKGSSGGGNSNGNKSNEERKFPPIPPPGGHEIVSWKGSNWKFCSKCRGGKGFWRKAGSSSAHTTAEHVAGKTASVNVVKLDDNGAVITACVSDNPVAHVGPVVD